jgi:hypothetical protein
MQHHALVRRVGGRGVEAHMEHVEQEFGEFVDAGGDVTGQRSGFRVAGSSANSVGQWWRIMPAHEPDGTMIGQGSRNRSSCARATLRACSGLPLL